MEFLEAGDIDIQKYFLILKRRWIPAVSVFSSFMGIAAVLSCLQKPVYQAQGKILLKKIDQTSALTGLGEQIGQLNGVNLIKSDPLQTEAAVIGSTPLIQKTITTLNLKDKNGEPLKPDTLATHLKVKQLPAADVLQVLYSSTNPQEATAVVNELMNLYIKNNIRNNRAEAAAAGVFIAKQLPETEATVHQADLAMRQFKEQNHVVDLGEESKSAVEVIQQLQIQINQTQAELANANASLANIQSKVNMDSQAAIALNSLNQSGGVQKVLEELQQVEDQLAVQRTRLQPDHPTIVNLKFREAALKALIQKRIGQTGSQLQLLNGNLQVGGSKQKLIEDFVKLDVEKSGLLNQLAKLSNTEATYKQRLNILPKLEQEQRALERRLEVAQSTYEILLKKLQEARVAENQNMGNARIIEPALVPQKPSHLKSAVILFLGGMLGILFSLVTVLILEVRDTSIKTLKEAKELFGYTLLGVIPSLKKKATKSGRDTESAVPELPVRDTPRLPICEAYRMLQANLKFLSSDKALKVIVVTSSVPKEGKSKVSANLAATMAQLGRRVLLVDADMRHPSQHHIWALTNVAGLSDVIVGQVEFSAVVTQVMAKMDVLASGVIPPNPLALLDSKRMASLIEYFSEQYDFVVIDAPPLVVAADALTLSKMTDGVLLVARPKVVDSHSAVAAKEALERSGQKALGLVVNDVSLENEYYVKKYSGQEDYTTRQQTTSNT